MDYKPPITVERHISEYSWVFKAYVETIHAGWIIANTSKENELCLGHFEVFDKQQVTYPDKKWWNLKEPEPEYRDFRLQKVGSKLLEEFFKEVEKHDLLRIYGTITKEHLKATPYLIDIYESRGFKLLSPDKECVGDAAYKIEKLLLNSPS